MTAMKVSQLTIDAATVECKLGAVLADVDPEIAGAALGMVVATWLVGMHPNARQDSRTMLIELIDDLVPVVLNEMIALGRVPANWKEPLQ